MTALNPPPSLLTKIGSIARHAEEYFSEDGHTFDREAITSLLTDPEVVDWMMQMDAMALLPRKRSA